MAEIYKDRLLNITHSGQVSVLLGIAKEIGIFDTLKTTETPLTAQQVADSKHLKERYVREILGCLAAAKLVNISMNDGGENTYFLDQEGKKCLEDISSPFVCFPLVLARASENVLPCFHVDGPYASRYDKRTFKFLDDVKLRYCDTIVDTFLRYIPEIKEQLENGIDVVEFGSGSGRVLARFAAMFPNSRFSATEVNEGMVEEMKSMWGHLPNLSFHHCDISAVPDSFIESFDWGLTIDVIHDLPNPQEALKEIRRCLKKPNGIFSFWDIFGSGSHVKDVGNMRAAAQYAISTLLCIPESFQKENSLAYGSCWEIQTAIDIATAAGYSVKAFNIDIESLLVCRLDEGKA